MPDRLLRSSNIYVCIIFGPGPTSQSSGSGEHWSAQQAGSRIRFRPHPSFLVGFGSGFQKIVGSGFQNLFEIGSGQHIKTLVAEKSYNTI